MLQTGEAHEGGNTDRENGRDKNFLFADGEFPFTTCTLLSHGGTLGGYNYDFVDLTNRDMHKSFL